MPLVKCCLAEFIGTFWLVFGGCGSSIFAAAFPNTGIGILGVSLAFGIAVMTMGYAIGDISGAHLNPAVSIGFWAARRFPLKYLLPYLGAQVLGGIFGAGMLYLMASRRVGFDVAGGFAANGFGANSPGGYTFGAAIVGEFILTFMFLFIVLRVTEPKVSQGFAPLAIGLTYTLIHLISIPITNTSINPARSTATALFAKAWALNQLWVFWVFPMAGAIAAGLIYKFLFAPAKD